MADMLINYFSLITMQESKPIAANSIRKHYANFKKELP